MSPGLYVYLLGELRALYQGKWLPLKAPPKTAPLWGYLLLHRGQPISRMTLASTLWLDEPEEAARTNLRRHLYHLRQALPPPSPSAPWLVSDNEKILWNPKANYWLDVAEFEHLSQNPETLDQAIDLYHGELLQGEYEDWIFPHRERLETIYISNLGKLIQRHWPRREYHEAISYAQRLLAHDPLREDTVRQMMALLYESGDRSTALKVYEAFLRRLQQELGVEPMAETISIYEAILRQRQLPQGGQPAEQIIVGSRSQPTALPFVGRESEMETLQSHWRRAVGGDGGVLLVTGEPGIGKTRLIDEFVRQVENQGGRILRGDAHSSQETPYHGFVSALRSALPMLSAVEIDPLWLSVTAHLVPELRERWAQAGHPLPKLSPLDPQREKARLFEGVVNCLEGLARPRPLVLVLEDIHSAGPGAIGLLEYLARRVSQQPILILGTYRPLDMERGHPLHELRRALLREGLAEYIPLSPFNIENVQDLLEVLPGESPIPTKLATQLHRTSGGNPFFLVEVIQDGLASGQIRLEDGQWALAPSPNHSIPSGVRPIVQARLTRLTSGPRTLVEVCAVIGKLFNIELIGSVCGWAEGQVLDWMDELLDHKIVQEAVSGGRFDFTFTHELIQTAVYDAIPQPARTNRHRRIAHVLESEKFGEPAAVLARHFDFGAESEPAARYYHEAAQEAMTVYADEEALNYLKRALELTIDDNLRYFLLAERDDLHHRRGERTPQQAGLEELHRLARELDGNELICDSLRRFIRWHHALSERDDEEEKIKLLKELAANINMPRWQAEALRADAVYRMSLGQYDEARKGLEEARARYHSLGMEMEAISCTCKLVEVDVHQSRLPDAQERLKETQALIEAHGNPSSLVETLLAASAATFAQQEYSRTRELAGQMLELCMEIGDQEGEADAHTRLGTVAARLMRVEQARQHYAQASNLYERVGKRQGQAAVVLNAGMLENRLGRYAEAIDMFQRAESLFETIKDQRGQAICALNRSAAAIYSEDYAQASSAARSGLELSRTLELPLVEAAALGNLGTSHLALGDAEKAIQLLLEAISLRQELNLPPAESAWDWAILTQAYLRAGNLDKAQETMEALLTLHEAEEDRIVYPQHLLMMAAHTFQALGESRRAKRLLKQAHQALESKVALIEDPESRTAYLQLPFNRELIDIIESGL